MSTDNLKVTLTQEIYELSRPPEVRALIAMPDPVARRAKADELAASGVVLCAEIDAWGGEADLWMATWAKMGLTWWPSYGQPMLVVAGGIQQQITKIDVAHPWPNSIRVSVDAKDYPPHDPAVVPPKELLVGSPQNADGTWPITSPTLSAIGEGSLHVGQTVPQDGKRFKLASIMGGWGPVFWFDEVS
jgi:hypothetical protein